ncbi:MAG: excinuclease ABC subunit UvrA [Candidatus Eisenbacteria bacterium]
MNEIVIKGARQHNLKNINLRVPHRCITVITGVSGSGKSSLAFDTIYAEGQRRYVESLSTYARQFLERVSRPDVDEIRGLQPAVAVQQANPTKTSRSTVGTATEIYDLLRLLYARVGVIRCEKCHVAVTRGGTQQGTDYAFSLGEGKMVMIGFPLEVSVPAEIKPKLISLGFARVRHKDSVREVASLDDQAFERGEVLDVIVDRLSIEAANRSRVAEAVELCLAMSPTEEAHIIGEKGEVYKVFSGLRCPKCGKAYENPSPLLFSFNSPYGACPECKGFGNKLEFDVNLIVPNKDRTLEGDAVEPWSRPQFQYFKQWLLRACKGRDVPTNVAYSRLSEEDRDLVLHGHGRFPGAIGFLERLRAKGYKAYARFFAKRYMSLSDCPGCRGTRLKPEAMNVRVGKLTISELTSRDIGKVKRFFKRLKLGETENAVAADILREIDSRLTYLLDVGLDYLTLDRQSKTLSGGEAQRINLSSALGAGLTGTLYVLDEPTIGLHARDTDRLLGVLKKLRSHGNTVVVVEHDPRVILGGDYVIDLGPGAGTAGGHVLFKGKPAGLKKASRSITGKYLTGRMRIDCGTRHNQRQAAQITIRNASEHNLKGIDIRIPLYALVCVTGVSGSGKSTLVEDVLYNAIRSRTAAVERVGTHDGIDGLEHVRDVVLVDQSPIGRTPRSNPITYVKGFDAIRAVFAATRDARTRGYTRSTFSFNLSEGRCEACRGEGITKIEMHFMADIYVPCEECFGRRYKRGVLEVEYKGKTISDVLELTVTEAIDHFRQEPLVLPPLYLLEEVGLEYIRLGQSATTLSGGEAQRLKIAREISRGDNTRMLYILDEPTTGLHLHDTANLVGILRRLVHNGNTVLVIEHNLEVIKCADHVIDLGPEGGDKGGRLVCEGTPRQIAEVRGSHTGRLLKEVLKHSKKLD